MNREQKKQAVINLTEQVNNATNLYLTDSSALSVETINKFRSKCYDNDIKFQVVKNTLLEKLSKQVILTIHHFMTYLLDLLH